MSFFGGIRASTAKISACGKYRYNLTRTWEPAKPMLVVIMLNPSKANATENDHTIRWLITYASANGYGGIIVVNLFAYRATVPADMMQAADPVGPENDAHIIEALRSADNGGQVLVAWGAHGGFKDRDREVMKLMAKEGRQPVCLELTRANFPKHPARLSYRLVLRTYEGRQ